MWRPARVATTATLGGTWGRPRGDTGHSRRHQSLSAVAPACPCVRKGPTKHTRLSGRRPRGWGGRVPAARRIGPPTPAHGDDAGCGGAFVRGRLAACAGPCQGTCQLAPWRWETRCHGAAALVGGWACTHNSATPWRGDRNFKMAYRALCGRTCRALVSPMRKKPPSPRMGTMPAASRADASRLRFAT